MKTKSIRKRKTRTGQNRFIRATHYSGNLKKYAKEFKEFIAKYERRNIESDSKGEESFLLKLGKQLSTD